MTLTFAASLAERHFDLELQMQPGETVAVLGPNGAGKSTLLNILAGLLRPDAGRAELDGVPLFDLEGGRRLWTSPQIRGISMLAQDADLFPHLSALENVAFGPRSKGARKAKAHELAEHWLEEVDALELAARKPAQLSGGQAQRVSIARALASDPKLLLLDEPTAGMNPNESQRLTDFMDQLRREKDLTILLIEHDMKVVMGVSEHIWVLDHGEKIAEGEPEAIRTNDRVIEAYLGKQGG
jgi:molybdate transport system ATP-binding protein